MAAGLLLLTTLPLTAQTPTKFLGSVTAIQGTTLTVKTDAGDSRPVEVPATAVLKQIEPGAKDLSAAVTIQFSDLAAGDRVLVKLDPNAAAPTALQIIAIKAADVALKQQKEREEWQQHGVGGLVKSVDVAGGVIVLKSGSGASAKTITVHTAKATVLKRYAAASVRFDDATVAPIDAIHAGDQLRARGEKNADGTEITADEIVSGSFRNLSGMIVSIDAAGSTLALKDLATKKQITIHITPDAQMRRLPDRMAQALAARLKGTTGGAPGGQRAGGGQWSGQNANAGTGNGAGHGQWNGGAGAPGGSGGWGGGGDPQQMLSRAPAIQLADLQKGEAVMVVSTAGSDDVTAITLLAGVEPLLESPDASRDLLANWSVGGSGGEDAAQ